MTRPTRATDALLEEVAGLGVTGRWPARIVTVVAVAVPAIAAGLFGLAAGVNVGLHRAVGNGLPMWFGWAVLSACVTVQAVVFGLWLWRWPGRRRITASGDLVGMAINSVVVTDLAVIGLMCCLSSAGAS